NQAAHLPDDDPDDVPGRRIFLPEAFAEVDDLGIDVAGQCRPSGQRFFFRLWSANWLNRHQKAETDVPTLGLADPPQLALAHTRANRSLERFADNRVGRFHRRIFDGERIDPL